MKAETEPSGSVEEKLTFTVDPVNAGFGETLLMVTVGGWSLIVSDEVPDPGKLALKLTVNGELRQDAHTSDLILSVAQLIEWGSSFYTLHPGDVILTGTPQGVGPVRPGDVMLATIERIGSMQVRVT